MALFSEDHLAETVIDIRHAARMAHDVVRNSIETIRGLVWENPHGLKPQDVMNALGKDAGELEKYLPPLVACADTVSESKIASWVPTGKTVTVAEDGSVTVADKVTVEPKEQ